MSRKQRNERTILMSRRVTDMESVLSRKVTVFLFRFWERVNLDEVFGCHW